MIRKFNKNKGFTLIEILVVIGIIAILAAVVLIAINPARQFAQARNSQRTSNVNAILNAIGQRMVDNKGVFETGCAAGALPSTAKVMEKASGGYDIRPCLVSTYIPELPYDPSKSGAGNTCKDTTAGDCAVSGTYDTEYTVVQDSTTKRITVCAPEAVNETAIQPSPVTICITR